MAVFKLRIIFWAKRTRFWGGLIILTLLIISCVSIEPVLAGSTGTIIGTVLDIKDKSPLPGVNVIIQGTSIGAATNMNGSFKITNISPGTYTLKAALLGYKISLVNDIDVMDDSVINIDFELKADSLTWDIIPFGSYPPPVDKYETNLIIRVPYREISRLPVKDLRGILKSQGLTVSRNGAIHIRGSRAGDVAIIDDGVLIRDQLGGH